MSKFYITVIFILFANLIFSQNDSIKNIVLEEVEITANPNLRLIPKNGKYEVNVAGTTFQETENVWEGLKQVPLLRVLDGNAVKVTTKTALIEINGIETQMSSRDLEDYLKSLDPKTIKRIEIISNPNASYETGVSAVVNIVLSQKQDNYRLGINSTNGFRTKYYNSSNANYSINQNKTKLYTNYSFSYLPKTNTSEVSQQIASNSPLNLSYKDNELSKRHQAFVNVHFDVSDKDKIDLTSGFNFNENETKGNNFNEVFNKEINLQSNGNNLRFAEVWKHNFNDSVVLKTGSYQVFRKSEAINFSETNNNTESQTIKTSIPILIVFADYNNKNKYGFSSVGFRFNSIDVENDNFSVNQNSPFFYSEQVFAAYFNHNIPFSGTKSLDFGIRSESTVIDFSFKNPFENQYYKNEKNYTNLLYNLVYNWYNSETERVSSVAFKKQIQRPNYSYLNPFQSINSDITYFSGDYSINPAKYYTLNYETIKNEWTFYVNNGLIKDFISSFYESENQNIILTYQNFETVYYTGIGVEYNNNFFNKKWINKSTLDLTYFKLKDKKYELENSTPSTSFSTTNIFNLGKNLKLNINYSTSLPFKDGTLEHYFSQKLDFVLTKKFNSNFTMLLFVYDIFKTSINGSETTVPNYFYASKYYNDVCSFGLSLRWNITGKSFKNREIEQPTGAEIDRL